MADRPDKFPTKIVELDKTEKKRVGAGKIWTVHNSPFWRKSSNSTEAFWRVSPQHIKFNLSWLIRSLLSQSLPVPTAQSTNDTLDRRHCGKTSSKLRFQLLAHWLLGHRNTKSRPSLGSLERNIDTCFNFQICRRQSRSRRKALQRREEKVGTDWITIQGHPRRDTPDCNVITMGQWN